ncbi:hypothetical protein ACHAXT_001621 [Thalassiosira profunda]
MHRLLLFLALLLAARPPSAGAFSVPADAPGRQRVVIIGAGVGGLATAARVASRLPGGAEVVVLEKNGRDFVGGRCGGFDVDVAGYGTFRHERGPSLLLLREEYERLFADCSTRGGSGGDGDAASAYGLEMKQCIPAYQVVFDDGDAVSVGYPRSKCTGDFSLEEVKQMQISEQESIAKLNSIEPDGFRKWQEYLDTCAAYLDCGLPNFIEERLDLPSFPAFLVEALREGGKRWPLKPHSSVLSSLFESPKMVALASFQDLYVGLEPYSNEGQIGGGVLRKTAPAVFGLLAAIELHPTNARAGVFAPVGGFRQVAESMHQLCLDNGVKFQFDTSVIKLDDDGVHFLRKKDAEGEGEQGFLPADLIICNADVPFATETIAQSSASTDAKYQETYDWNGNFDYSSGVIAFHWSISKSLDELNTHNVFMSANTTSDALESWAVLRGDGGVDDRSSSIVGQPFNFYVHRPSQTDETACPAGCDSIMVLVPCSTLARNEELASLPRDEAIEAYKQQFDADVIDDAREAVLQRLSVLKGLENLRESILDEMVDTPGTYADYYNVAAGVPFGLSHGLGQLSLTRPAAECKSQKNVLFVGASSRPGNGVPLVLLGSKQVSEKAIDKLNNIIER